MALDIVRCEVGGLSREERRAAVAIRPRKGTTKAEADLGKAEKGFRLARKFLEDSSGTYRGEADPLTRRHCNQVFFRRIFVGPQGVKAVELTGEFGALLREELAEEVEAFMANPTAALRAGQGVRLSIT